MNDLRPLSALIVSVVFCLAALTACAPSQTLSAQEKSANLERLQSLKQELAALKQDLAEARAREAQTEPAPAPDLQSERPRPAWFNQVGTASWPAEYGYHATLIGDKKLSQEALVRLLTLIEALQLDATAPSRKQTLFVVPGLDPVAAGLSLDNYDDRRAAALLESWPGSNASSGPYLLIESADAQYGSDGHLLIHASGLNVHEIEGLLKLLLQPRSADMSTLLLELLRYRNDRPARVTSHGLDFILEWR